jgi:hypothetical protein
MTAQGGQPELGCASTPILTAMSETDSRSVARPIVFLHVLDYNSKNLNTFSSLRFFNTSWQETCTVQDEPPHGEIGRCGVYDGFYSRRCCSPRFPNVTNCYKREAWIRPGYLDETFDTTVIEVTDTCRTSFGFGEGCLLQTNRIHIDCGDDGLDDNECSSYGPGWFIGHDGRCVPPACQTCYDNGGTYCSTGADCWTPVLIDVRGNGFALTDAEGGIIFTPDSNAHQIRTAWTVANSDDAWLVLDRNSNGTIYDGTELFGNATPQSTPPVGELKNGFRALAEFDKPDNGGNGDGMINRKDAIFSRLRLWQDANHNGISEPNELHTLPELGVVAIELDYKESRRVDEYGNHFRYRARVLDERGTHTGKWAFNVFLVARQQ